MKFLSTILMLGGYTLVYAAVAKHGAFYSNPWMGLFRDAWGVDSNAYKKAENIGGITKSAEKAARRRTPAAASGSTGP